MKEEVEVDKKAISTITIIHKKEMKIQNKKSANVYLVQEHRIIMIWGFTVT
jgi:hypothetical protein